MTLYGTTSPFFGLSRGEGVAGPAPDFTPSSHGRYGGETSVRYRGLSRREALMLSAVELEGDEDLISPVSTWSHRPRDGDWIAGYDELVRATGAFTRGLSFLSRHWNELEPETLGGLL